MTSYYGDDGVKYFKTTVKKPKTQYSKAFQRGGVKKSKDVINARVTRSKKLKRPNP